MLCNRDYKRNGHWETRLVLHPEEPIGAKELVYGPYLGSLHHAAGPKVGPEKQVTRRLADKPGLHRAARRSRQLHRRDKRDG
jgi:hypothetical protein